MAEPWFKLEAVADASPYESLLEHLRRLLDHNIERAAADCSQLCQQAVLLEGYEHLRPKALAAKQAHRTLAELRVMLG